VIGVDFGSKPDGFSSEGIKYANKRAEIWGGMKEWLAHGSIQNISTGENIVFTDELTAPTYGLNAKEAIQLESKKEMRSRGVPSPNVGTPLPAPLPTPLMSIPLLGRRRKWKSQPSPPTTIRSPVKTSMKELNNGIYEGALPLAAGGLVGSQLFKNKSKPKPTPIMYGGQPMKNESLLGTSRN